MDTIFQTSSLFVMPFWFLMIFLPRWSVTRRIIASPWIAVGPALIYAALVLPRIGAVLPAVANPSLPGVQALLGTATGRRWPGRISWRSMCSSGAGSIWTLRSGH